MPFADNPLPQPEPADFDPVALPEMPRPPVVIPDAQGGVIEIDNSNILFDLEKWNARPRGLDEAESGYKRRSTAGTMTVERVYRVPWSVYIQAEQWFRGFATTLFSTVSSEPFLTRTIPAQDPVQPWLYCVDVELLNGEGAAVNDPANIQQVETPLLSPGGVPLSPPVFVKEGRLIPAIAYVGRAGTLEDGQGNFQDGRALLRVTFAPLNYEVRNDTQANAWVDAHPTVGREQGRFVERTEQPAIEALPLARIGANTLKFEEGPVGIINQPVPEAGVLLLATKQITHMLHDWPDPVFDTLEARMGTVNESPLYAGPGRSAFEPETCLLLQPGWQRSPRNVSGKVTWEVKLRWAWRKQGWNKFPASDGNFYRATLGSGLTAKDVYQSADHNDLYKVTAPVDYQNG